MDIRPEIVYPIEWEIKLREERIKHCEEEISRNVELKAKLEKELEELRNS